MAVTTETRVRVRKATLNDYEFILELFSKIKYHWWFIHNKTERVHSDTNFSLLPTDFITESLQKQFENDVKNFRTILEKDLNAYYVIEDVESKKAIGYLNLQPTTKRGLKRLLEWALLPTYQNAEIEQEILDEFKLKFLKKNQLQVCVPPNSLGNDFFVKSGFEGLCFLESQW